MKQDKTTEQLLASIQRTIWPVAPMSVMPKIFLSNWSIWKAGSELYFVGFNELEGVGRVSSPIVAFDAKSLCGMTESGRHYQMLGIPGRDPAGMHVWAVLRDNSEITDADDLTEAVSGFGSKSKTEKEMYIATLRGLRNAAEGGGSCDHVFERDGQTMMSIRWTCSKCHTSILR